MEARTFFEWAGIVPDFFVLCNIEREDTRIRYDWASRSRDAVCPRCDTISQTPAHEYVDQPWQDLPQDGRAVWHHVRRQKYVCRNPECPQHDFVERWPGFADEKAVFRFPSDDAVAKYAGLTWRAHQSGTFDAEDRPPTRSGNAYLRYYLIEAADRVRVRGPEFEAFYIRKYSGATHHPHKQALVLTARQLTGVIYGLLTRGQLDDGRRFGA